MVWEYYSFENKKTQTITQSIKENGIAGDCYGNQDTKQYNILWNRTRDSKQRDKKDCLPDACPTHAKYSRMYIELDGFLTKT